MIKTAIVHSNTPRAAATARRLRSAIVATAGSIVAAVTGPAAADSPLALYAWENRPILIFAPDNADPNLIRQRKTLAAHLDGLRERDIVVIETIGDAVTVDSAPVAAPTAKRLRDFAEIGPEGFHILLVGKDSGVKLLSAEPIDVGQLFGLIDSMPMRLEEMRKQ